MDEQQAPRHRSPPFPFIDLEKALERARQFHEKQRHHPAPASIAVTIWGYAAKSSGGIQTLAALKHFGLLVDEGSGADRRVSLTNLALQIIRDTRNPSPERDERIKKATLTPKLHQELWAKFGPDLPAEGTVVYYLEMERGGFTNRSAAELIAEYAETLRFAKLDESDKLTDESRDAGADSDEPIETQLDSPPTPPKGRSEPGKVSVMEGERVVFTEESSPQRYFKLIASGDPDELLLEALSDYVKRQRRRLGLKEPGDAP